MNIIGDYPPPKPVEGDLWFDTKTGVFYYWSSQWDGWVDFEQKIPTVQTKEQFEQWAVDAVTQ